MIKDSMVTGSQAQVHMQRVYRRFFFLLPAGVMMRVMQSIEEVMVSTGHLTPGFPLLQKAYSFATVLSIYITTDIIVYVAILSVVSRMTTNW